EQIVRAGLVEPACLAVADVARKNPGGPFIVAGALGGIPGAGIAGAVIDEVAFRVVADPAPGIAAAEPPALRLPGPDAEIPPPIARIKWMEARPNQHVRVWPGRPGLPELPAAAGVERDQPAADAELTARIADQYAAFGDQRRHGDRLADIDVAELDAPELASASDIEGDLLTFQRVEEQASVGVAGAAIDDVAAGDALRPLQHGWAIGPFHAMVGTGEIERRHDIWKRRDHEHGRTDDQGRRLMPLRNAGREGEDRAELSDIPSVDLVE